MWRSDSRGAGCCRHGLRTSGSRFHCYVLSGRRVLVGSQRRTLSVSVNGEAEQDVLLWLDHRAARQAERITWLGHPLLRQFGGRMSPEMQPAKLLWLREEMPARFAQARHFFDLGDYLTWRASDSSARSRCTLACKWGYTEKGWDPTFWRQIGLAELVDDAGDPSQPQWERLGLPQMVREVGEAVGLLGSQAAGELGLPAGLPVAACLIDAHAGALALLALPSRSPQWSRLALIAGTSTCAILLSPEPVEVPGVWGPYWGPVVPSMYALEAGESATGALLEYLLRGHPAAARLGEPLERLVPRLNELLHHMAARRALPLGLLARDRHILPYFHGNRSPRADPQLRGMIAGLTLQEDIEDLAVTYLACLQALAYGVRHICAALRERGLEVRELCLGGGLARNPLFVQCLADGASLPCIMLAPDRAEAMLLGAAMAGAAASQLHADVGTGMTAMAGSIEGVRCVQPSEDETVSSFHEAKYEIFLAMHDHLKFYQTKMQQFGT